MQKKETIPEMLTRFNTGDTLTLLKENVTNESLKMVFGYGFIPKGKWVLPEGIPPYKEDSAPEGMTPGNLWMETRSFDRFTRTDLAPAKREQLFIQLLENVHPTEAKLVIAIKDQTITEMYPNITLDKIVDSGFFIWPWGIDEVEYRASVKEVKKVKAPKEPKVESNQPNSGEVKKSRGRPKKTELLA
jgi:hypothetical protein